MDLFAACAPGLEPVLVAELGALGLRARPVAGGAELEGGLREVERMNLWLRTAGRVLVRLGQAKATTFAELVRKARALPFETVLRRGEPVSLRVTCHKSRLYHSRAVAQRLHEALQERLGGPAPLAEHDEEGPAPAQLLLARFDHDVCTVSADSSGALLHRRGYRLAQSQAPLRETLAAAVLLAAGYTGSEPSAVPGPSPSRPRSSPVAARQGWRATSPSSAGRGTTRAGWRRCAGRLASRSCLALRRRSPAPTRMPRRSPPHGRMPSAPGWPRTYASTTFRCAKRAPRRPVPG